MKITVEIDEDDARLLEDFVQWARTDHVREVVPSKDADTAYAMRVAMTRISSTLQEALSKD